ncbi:MAG: hypothetical protein ACI9KE_002256 [Polyangiales bacterium]|jgi:hypothetical protein
MRLVLLCALACSVLSSCSVVTCPDCFEGGEQVDADLGSDVLDGGADLSEPDARSACRTSCEPPQPYCVEPSGVCVECIDNTHCPGERECRNGSCAQCAVDPDCTSPEAPVCSQSGATAGQCVPCELDGGCDGIINASGDALAVCDPQDGAPNICVVCNGGPDECAGFVCDVQARECTVLSEATAPTCAPCLSSAQCQDGGVCAQEVFGGAATGFFCLPPASSGCVLPRIYVMDAWTSVEGEVFEVCHPASTTCQALLDYSEMCADNSTCGLPEVDDGVCQLPAGRCTYLCAGNADCEGAGTCPIASPRVCVRE